MFQIPPVCKEQIARWADLKRVYPIFDWDRKESSNPIFVYISFQGIVRHNEVDVFLTSFDSDALFLCKLET